MCCRLTSATVRFHSDGVKGRTGSTGGGEGRERRFIGLAGLGDAGAGTGAGAGAGATLTLELGITVENRLKNCVCGEGGEKTTLLRLPVAAGFNRKGIKPVISADLSMSYIYVWLAMRAAESLMPMFHRWVASCSCSQGPATSRVARRAEGTRTAPAICVLAVLRVAPGRWDDGMLWPGNCVLLEESRVREAERQNRVRRICSDRRCCTMWPCHTVPSDVIPEGLCVIG